MLHRPNSNNKTNYSNNKNISGKTLLTASVTLFLATLTGCSTMATDTSTTAATVEAPLNADSKAWFDAGAVKVAQNEAEVKKIITEARQ